MKAVMQMTRRVPVLCPYRKECQNYLAECHRCKYNVALDFGNYLVLKANGEREAVRFLEEEG